MKLLFNENSMLAVPRLGCHGCGGTAIAPHIQPLI